MAPSQQPCRLLSLAYPHLEPRVCSVLDIGGPDHGELTLLVEVHKILLANQRNRLHLLLPLHLLHVVSEHVPSQPLPPHVLPHDDGVDAEGRALRVVRGHAVVRQLAVRAQRPVDESDDFHSSPAHHEELAGVGDAKLQLGSVSSLVSRIGGGLELFNHIEILQRRWRRNHLKTGRGVGVRVETGSGSKTRSEKSQGEEMRQQISVFSRSQ
eukprot:752570-Hanusia_phi.AAC.1